MNPYNHNPFTTDDHEIKNEHDANKELARSRDREELANIFRLEKDEYGFWRKP